MLVCACGCVCVHRHARVSVYACVRVCTRVSMLVCACGCVCMHRHARVFVYACARVCTRVSMLVCAHVHACACAYIRRHRHVRVCVYASACLCARVCMRVRARICACEGRHPINLLLLPKEPSCFSALSSPTRLLTCCPVPGLEEVAHNKPGRPFRPLPAHLTKINILPNASFTRPLYFSYL
jgi:hypothetical protein